MNGAAGFIVLLLVIFIVLLVIVAVVKAVQVIPQATAAVIERLGKYKATAPPGLTFLVPFIDKIRARIDLREQVVSFPPQPVITQDNLTVSIDTVVYFQVTDPKSAVYEISNYIVGVEQLTTTTLRNVVGGMSLEDTLTSRDEINQQLRGVLDEATGRWGIRVARVELKAIDPPPSIQESMERQMKADREKRAMILTAEGQRESAIRSAEGRSRPRSSPRRAPSRPRSCPRRRSGSRDILRAQGDRAARYLQAQGQAKAIEKVFAAIKAGKPTPELLAYQYLQTLPQMAQGEANKVWLVPSDFGKALEGFTRMLGAPGEDGVFRFEPEPGRRCDQPAGGGRRAGQGLVRHDHRPGDRQGGRRRRGRGPAGGVGDAAGVPGMPMPSPQPRAPQPSPPPPAGNGNPAMTGVGQAMPAPPPPAPAPPPDRRVFPRRRRSAPAERSATAPAATRRGRPDQPAHPEDGGDDPRSSPPGYPQAPQR